MRNLRTVSLLVVCLLFTATGVIGNVSLKNGNFFIGYTDALYTGGFEPKIERVYNSKTPYKGIFGWGWGNEYEVYLRESVAGSVVVHEFGGGAENDFWPAEIDAQAINDGIEAMVEAKRAQFRTPTELAAYRDTITKSVTYRRDEWNRLVDAGKLTPQRVPLNTRLFSNRFSYQHITRTADGYVRTFDNGRVETFNDKGKLVRISDQNGNFIDFTYNDAGRMNGLTDNFGRGMDVSYNDRGLVSSIVKRSDGKKAEYRYDEHDNLVWTSDTDGNVYTHKYDVRHNMTEIGYEDGTTMEMTYNRAFHENIASVKDRDGTRTLYHWETRPDDRDWLAVRVTVLASGGDTLSSARYEYTERQKANGVMWTQRMVVEDEYSRKETTYNECCGVPILITVADREENGGYGEPQHTRFEYDEHGRVLLKDSPRQITRTTYDPQLGKVTRAVVVDKERNDSTWSQFRYDARGNLAHAENSAGTAITLAYDANGRIDRINTDEGSISFKYNQHSKPVEITHSEKGALKVTYTPEGEIEKVDSESGRAVALAITAAFQDLMDLVRPAGVSLSF